MSDLRRSKRLSKRPPSYSPLRNGRSARGALAVGSTSDNTPSESSSPLSAPTLYDSTPTSPSTSSTSTTSPLSASTPSSTQHQTPPRSRGPLASTLIRHLPLVGRVPVLTPSPSRSRSRSRSHSHSRMSHSRLRADASPSPAPRVRRRGKGVTDAPSTLKPRAGRSAASSLSPPDSVANPRLSPSPTIRFPSLSPGPSRAGDHEIHGGQQLDEDVQSFSDHETRPSIERDVRPHNSRRFRHSPYPEPRPSHHRSPCAEQQSHAQGLIPPWDQLTRLETTAVSLQNLPVQLSRAFAEQETAMEQRLAVTEDRLADGLNAQRAALGGCIAQESDVIRQAVDRARNDASEDLYTGLDHLARAVKADAKRNCDSLTDEVHAIRARFAEQAREFEAAAERSNRSMSEVKTAMGEMKTDLLQAHERNSQNLLHSLQAEGRGNTSHVIDAVRRGHRDVEAINTRTQTTHDLVERLLAQCAADRGDSASILQALTALTTSQSQATAALTLVQEQLSGMRSDAMKPLSGKDKEVDVREEIASLRADLRRGTSPHMSIDTTLATKLDSIVAALSSLKSHVSTQSSQPQPSMSSAPMPPPATTFTPVVPIAHNRFSPDGQTHMQAILRNLIRSNAQQESRTALREVSDTGRVTEIESEDTRFADALSTLPPDTRQQVAPQVETGALFAHRQARAAAAIVRADAANRANSPLLIHPPSAPTPLMPPSSVLDPSSSAGRSESPAQTEPEETKLQAFRLRRARSALARGWRAVSGGSSSSNSGRQRTAGPESVVAGPADDGVADMAASSADDGAMLEMPGSFRGSPEPESGE